MNYAIEVDDREAAAGASEARVTKALAEFERVKRAGRRKFEGMVEVFAASNGVLLTLRRRSR